MATTVQEAGIPASLLDTMNARKTGQKSAVEETQDRFMQLLVTQMRNQDPLNPLDNAQVTSQFAQLSTVTGIDKLNDTLASLMGNYQISQSLQAASMIGHGVLVPGSSAVDLKEGSGLFGADFSGPVDKAEVTIYDSNGVEVRTINVGEHEAGPVTLGWDGKSDNGTVLPDGRYTYKIAATKGDADVAVTPLYFGFVSTVATGTNGQGVSLNVEGLGKVNFTDVRQIL